MKLEEADKAKESPVESAAAK